MLPQTYSRATKIGGRGDYLSFVEALQSCLLARDCTVSIMRFEEASVEEPGKRCQTTRYKKVLGSRDYCSRESGSKRNHGQKRKK